MSRLRPGMSAPRRPMNATSAPSAASHAATFAPDPPPCMVTVAGVSLPRASGSIAWATVSVIRSPMTTMRAIVVITSLSQSPGGGASPCPAPVRGWLAAQRSTAQRQPDLGTLTVSASAYADQRVRRDGYQSEAVARRGSRPLTGCDATSVAKVTSGACRLSGSAGQEGQPDLAVRVVTVDVDQGDGLPRPQRQPPGDNGHAGIG